MEEILIDEVTITLGRGRLHVNTQTKGKDMWMVKGMECKHACIGDNNKRIICLWISADWLDGGRKRVRI